MQFIERPLRKAGLLPVGASERFHTSEKAENPHVKILPDKAAQEQNFRSRSTFPVFSIPSVGSMQTCSNF